MNKPANSAPFEVLPGPYATPPAPDGVKPSPAVLTLVRAQVRALLEASPAYLSLPDEDRHRLAHNLVKVAAYSAALMHEDWAQSRRLGQTPMIKQTVLAPLAPGAGAALEASMAATPPAMADEGAERAAGLPARRRAGVPLAQATAGKEPPPPPADEFSPRAVNQAARLTRETLNAVAFPTFVAELIKGTYQAIVDASIRQMEAYAQLLSNVAMTVDQFMGSNITDNQARDYLANRYPEHFRLDTSGDRPKLTARENTDDAAKPDFKNDFGLNDDIDISDESAEETLVPAARRKLAQQRHQVLATMVMMGINRIVVTSGRIKAGLQFHIDAHDSGQAHSASEFDFRNDTTTFGGGHFGFFGGGYASTTTVAYVSTTKKDSADSINLTTDLTGEVEVKFKSDYFPMERFANPNMIALIQGNTPNPAANTPLKPGSGQNQAAATA